MYAYRLLFLSFILGRVAALPFPGGDDSSSRSSSTSSSSRSHSPVPFPIQPYNKGDIVGVRPHEYELNPPKEISIHPGVVLDGPRENGKYGVAMISKKLPHDPPQQNVLDFHPKTSLYGNVALSPEKEARPQGMKPWKSDKTGQTEVPMPQHGVEKLKAAMVPHTGWREPSPPPPPRVPPASPRPGFKELHPGHATNFPVHNKNALKGIIPPKPRKPKNKKKKQEANAEASGSTAPGTSSHNPAQRAAQAQEKAKHPAVNHRLSPSRNHSPSRAHASAHNAVRGGRPHRAASPSRPRSKSPAGKAPTHPQRGRTQTRGQAPRRGRQPRP